MTRTTKIWLWVLGGCAATLLLCCSGVVLFVVYAAAEPENIAVQVDCPATVAAQDTFVIRVAITNEGTDHRELDSIDLYNGYAEGVHVTGGRPAWRSASAMFGFTTYAYGLSIPPGATQVVELDARAVRVGDFAGDLDVCIDSELSFISNVVRTVITPRER